MIVNWRILAAVPFALAIGACSSHSSNTDTAAGVLPGDTSTTLAPTPTIPNPGIDTGMVLDTTKQADSTRADSVKNDSTQESKTATTKHHNTTKKGTTKKKRA